MDGVLFGALAVVLFIVVLGGLVLVHELGHYLSAKALDVRVLEFGIGFPPRAKVLKRSGETLWTLNWLPIGGFVRMEGEDGDHASDRRAFSAKPLRVRITILVAGVAMNIVLAFVIFFLIALLAWPVVGARIGTIEPDSPAQAAGLVAGDEILGVAGETGFEFLGDRSLIDALRDRAGETVTIHVRHADGSQADVTATLRPRSELGPNRGALGVRDLIQTYDGYTGHDLGTAAGMATRDLATWGGLILGGLGNLIDAFIKDPTAPPQASGPLGIAVSLAGIFTGSGPILTLYFAAILSVNLGVVNILPFGPLDGGRAAMLIIRRLFGTRVSLRFERLTYAVGFVVLMAFMLWVTGFDIARLGTSP